MSDYNLENWKDHDAEITKLTQNCHKLIDSACSENYFGVEELGEIQGKMKILVEQGLFWLKQENPQRFVYDLRGFILWLCDYCAEIEESWNEEE